MANNDVPDSTDWLSTPLPGLAAVESALRCEVCKDFYKTPMMTSCFHTFCSLCIRRALSNDGKCPLCRTTDQQPRLRSNWAMEETVEAFVKARTATLDLARSRNEASLMPKRKAKDEPDETNDAPEGKRLRTSARLKNHRTDYTSYVEPEEQPEVIEVPDEIVDGLVPCPLCQSRMKEGEVWDHVSVCTGAASPKPKQKSSSSTPAFSQRQAHKTKPLERLPGLNYSMMKDVALRKKMTDLGISNQGSRKLLERRHKEWITIWNANCDSVRPRKRHELQHDLNAWERTQGGRAPVVAAVQNEAMVKDKEFDGAAWAAKHDSSFQDLIAIAKQSRLEAKRKAEEAKKEAAEEESRAAEAGPLIPMTPLKPTILDQPPPAIPTGPTPHVPQTPQSYQGQLSPTTTARQDPTPALQTPHASMPTPSRATAPQSYMDDGAMAPQPPASWSAHGSRDYPELPWQTALRLEVPPAMYPHEQSSRNDSHVQHAPRPSQEGVPSPSPGSLARPPQGGQ